MDAVDAGVEDEDDEDDYESEDEDYREQVSSFNGYITRGMPGNIGTGVYQILWVPHIT